MITGAEQPDSGSIELFGSRLERDSAYMRRRAGVAAIYQELMIVPAMSAAANVFLDNPPRASVVIRRADMRRAFLELSQRLGLSIDPDALAGSLSIADRQMLEIMRALTTRCRVMIMDEPTATLGPAEREKLFAVIDDLKQAGTAIIYISHDLDEVLRLADRISVMRDGMMVATGPRSDWTKDRIVSTMVGSKPIAATSARRAACEGEPALSVRSLTVPGHIGDVDFLVRKGEIFGIAGLVGSGRTEIFLRSRGRMGRPAPTSRSMACRALCRKPAGGHRERHRSRPRGPESPRVRSAAVGKKQHRAHRSLEGQHGQRDLGGAKPRPRPNGRRAPRVPARAAATCSAPSPAAISKSS